MRQGVDAAVVDRVLRPDRRGWGAGPGPLPALTVLALVVMALAPASLAAQQARLTPHLGFFQPLTSLGTAENDGGESFTLGERNRGFAYGISVQFGGGTLAGVRGSALFGTGSDVPVTGPGCGDEEACAVENSVRALVGTLVVRPLPGLVVIRPYVLAGGGWKRYGFDEADLESLGLEGAIGDHSNTTWQVGAGVELHVGLTAIQVELSDFISGFDVEEGRGEGRTQHDLFLTVGLRL